LALRNPSTDGQKFSAGAHQTKQSSFIQAIASTRVTAVNADRVTARIEDAGRHPHMIGDKPLVKGMSVESAATDWTPCPE
jgi:hypothetical protein